MIKLSEVTDGLEFVNDGLDIYIYIYAYFNPEKKRFFISSLYRLYN